MYLLSIGKKNLISKEGNIVLKMFRGNMTSYPLERCAIPPPTPTPQLSLASTMPVICNYNYTVTYLEGRYNKYNVLISTTLYNSKGRVLYTMYLLKYIKIEG